MKTTSVDLLLCRHLVCGFTISIIHIVRRKGVKTVLDSGFHAGLWRWNLDSRFQSLVGFRIPWTVFWIPKPNVPDSRSKTFPVSLEWGDKLCKINWNCCNLGSGSLLCLSYSCFNVYHEWFLFIRKALFKELKVLGLSRPSTKWNLCKRFI